MSKTYYPHIDGLRTVAVIPVVLYHLFAPLCPGGYSGVDVFFVISGYLIIGGILNNLGSENFSLSDFYYRRFRRIIPAYLLMVVLVLVMGMLVYPYPQLEELGESALASAFYVSNFYYHFNFMGYFSPDIENNALLNLWSLSVEEQFYLVIPLIFLIIWRVRARLMPAAIYAGIILSLAASLYLQWRPAEQLNFYMLPTRSWEFLAGGALRLCRPVGNGRKALVGVMSVVGLLLCLFPYIAYTSATSFPGLTAIPSVLGAALLIRYGFSGPVGAILKSRPFVFIGKISYSLYLYHWPVFVFMRYLAFDQAAWPVYIAAFLLSFLLAYLSWKYVETPFRIKSVPRQTVFAATAVGCLSVAGWGYTLMATDGARRHLHLEANRLEAQSVVEYLRPWYQNPDWPLLLNEKGRVEPLDTCGSPDVVPSILLLGNSHAEHLMPGLSDYLADTGQAAVRPIRYKYLLPDIDIYRGFDSKCLIGNKSLYAPAARMRNTLDWLRQNDDIRTVVISHFWLSFLNPDDLAARAHGQRRNYLEKDGKFYNLADHTDAYLALYEEGLEQTCREIHAMGKRIIIVAPLPLFRHSDPDFTRTAIILGSDKNNTLTQDQYNHQRQLAQQLLERLSHKLDIPVIDLSDQLLIDGRYRTHRENLFIYCDPHHLSVEGSKWIIRQTRRQWETLLPGPGPGSEVKQGE